MDKGKQETLTILLFITLMSFGVGFVLWLLLAFE